ncbi:unnamed protein product [Closterium sp. NIES-65]|nr:unnamed protein product [Closterium sp. NIES-65]
MATPSVLAFDAEGRAIDFEVWVDDLQLFLQFDRADGLSLFDLTSGASPAPAADADATVRSQWATRDAAARLAVRRHLPTSERAHFSQYKSAQTLYNAVVARYSSPATPALSRVEGVEVPVAAVGAEAAAVAEGAEEAAVAEAAVVVEAAVVAEAAEGAEVEVELVAGLRKGVAPVVVRASSSSVVVRPCPLSSSVSGAVHASGVGVLVRAPTSCAPGTVRVSSVRR